MSEGFDLRTHIRDQKTGRVTKLQPYRLVIGPDGRLFERPPGSGQWYAENGELMKTTAPDPKVQAIYATAAVEYKLPNEYAEDAKKYAAEAEAAKDEVARLADEVEKLKQQLATSKPPVSQASVAKEAMAFVAKKGKEESL